MPVDPGASALARTAPPRKAQRMDLLEIELKERLSREDAARRLHILADHLAQHNDVEFQRGGMQYRVHVPDEVQLKVEFEIEDDGTELEIELTW
jgi:amphi-Trp domain-containing protein